MRAFRKMRGVEREPKRIRVPQDGEAGPGIAPAMMRLRNSDTATDINTATLTTLPLDDASAIGSGFTQCDDTGTPDANGDFIRADFDGSVDLSASIWAVSASSQRPSIAVEFFKNTTSLGVRYTTGYIRLTSGNDDASTACPSYVEPCSSGDLFSARGIRDGNSGTVTMSVAGRSYLQAKRFS